MVQKKSESESGDIQVISHRHAKSDIVRPTSVLKCVELFELQKQLWLKVGLFQEKRGTAVKFRGR